MKKWMICFLLAGVLLTVCCCGTDRSSGQGAAQTAGAGTSETADSGPETGASAASAAAGSTGADSSGIRSTGAAAASAVGSSASASTGAEAAAAAPGAGQALSAEKEKAVRERATSLLSSMTTEEKISQMIIASIRTWDGTDVTDLTAVPELAEALQRHQYGGIILFASNITDSLQTRSLIGDLQENNAQIQDESVRIPYFIPVDEEGGIVIRFNQGTRMTGNMAIGATGKNGRENAEKTGEVLGEEMRALGFNVDFAPDMDVNSNPANPVIGTRSFSDDPQLVAELGTAFADGLAQNHIIATCKHFPGHGDTSVDSHIGTPSVEKTYEELQETELVPFAAAIDSGVGMIMTAHITFPLIDEEVTFGDGVERGFYPATMSKKMITEILRGDLGYDGVVVTDALEMDAIDEAGLVPGEKGSAEYAVNIAEKVINAGVDILLMPRDLTSAYAADFYDTYIAGLEQMVNEGTIPMERIDESVGRILRLKLQYGILPMEEESGTEADAVPGPETVGSEEHHSAELEIARQAATLLKNDGNVLPASGRGTRIVILGRLEEDITAINAIVDDMRGEGLLDENAVVTTDYYYDLSSEMPAVHYPEELRDAVLQADYVIGTTRTFGLDALYTGNPQYEAVRTVIEDTHAGGGVFILLSENLPYDAARYQEADAVVLAYMGSGLDVDPTARGEETGTRPAGNANVAAALETIFGGNTPRGSLPVHIPVLEEAEDGTLYPGSSLLYERGRGLTYGD